MLSSQRLGGQEAGLYKPIEGLQGPCKSPDHDLEHRKKMPCVQAIGQCYPDYQFTPETFEKLYCSDKFPYDEKLKDWVRKLVHQSGIETIPSSINPEQFDKEPIPFDPSIPVDEHNLYRRAKDPWCPTTHERSLIWEKFAPKLTIGAAKDVIREWGGDPMTITHVITNTSSGTHMPGLDLAVVDALGLKNIRQRICVDNTGCYGSFSALTVAQAFCAAEPDAVVLVTCTEVCSVHINKHSRDRSEILGNIIFGDGATSAILSAGQKGDWQMSPIRMVTAPPSTRDYVSVKLTDQGYLLYLSKYLAPCLHTAVKPMWRDMLKDSLGVKDSHDCDWAVHPGGKAVINVFHSEDLEMNLSKEDLEPSWESLRHHGNLAAPSILLVVKAVLERTAETEKDKVFVIGFGPGMVIKYYGLTRKE